MEDGLTNRSSSIIVIKISLTSLGIHTQCPCYVNGSVLSCPPEPDPSPVPRLCQIKCKEGQSFGFNLRMERSCRGYVVHQVDPWSPAELSGLKDGDRVLEVNEDFVDDMEFPRVRTRRPVMKVESLCTRLLKLCVCNYVCNVGLIHHVGQNQTLRDLREPLLLQGLQRCPLPRFHLKMSHIVQNVQYVASM